MRCTGIFAGYRVLKVLGPSLSPALTLFLPPLPPPSLPPSLPPHLPPSSHCLPWGLVIVCHVTSTPLGEPQRAEMVRYLRNVQRNDGGWGLWVGGRAEYSSVCIVRNESTIITILNAHGRSSVTLWPLKAYIYICIWWNWLLNRIVKFNSCLYMRPFQRNLIRFIMILETI